MRNRDDSRTCLVRPWLVLVAVLGLAVGLSSCTSEKPAEDDAAPVVQLGAPGESNTTLSPEEAEAVGDPAWTEADVEFVQMMLPHHQQALELTALVDGRAGDPDLAALAERIEAGGVPPARLVTARALAPLPRLLGYAHPLLQPGGACLFHKGAELDAELAACTDWRMRVERFPAPDRAGSVVLRVTELSRA